MGIYAIWAGDAMFNGEHLLGVYTVLEAKDFIEANNIAYQKSLEIIDNSEEIQNYLSAETRDWIRDFGTVDDTYEAVFADMREQDTSFGVWELDLNKIPTTDVNALSLEWAITDDRDCEDNLFLKRYAKYYE